MALPREYPSESCPIARSLEIIGERWTLLIMRDAFFGVRRFSDFRGHLGIPKAVLAERLSLLVDEGVLAKVSAPSGRDELTTKGRRLWPMIWSMITWGDENYIEKPTRRTYRHAECDGRSGRTASAPNCGQQPEVADLIVHPPRRPRDPMVATIRSAGCCGGRIDCWNQSAEHRRLISGQMWPALVGVVVGYGLTVDVSVVVVSGPPGESSVDAGGPVTTGLSWLVWTLGTV